ncbi:integrating conjugative element protein [Hydrogenophaga atypica]|uniref:Integrating conjugative element protein n=1 Tax=Hydrogenophaga atypica TaxID=249409 RepID=A0ABW2QPY8_9BURK
MKPMRFRPTHTALACVFAITLGCVSLAPTPVHAQAVSNSSLYYRLGGGDPAARANNKSQTALRLGLSLNIRANYSCGKFDIGLSWSNVMNGFSQLGQTIANAIKAGIASLPLYAFQRAQPGLYQLFQNFSQKADAMVSASLKTCEEMEALIKQGKNPYEDWISMAKGESWRGKAQASGDVVQAKLDINKNEEAQRYGVTWVFGQKAGGAQTPPIQPIRDLAVAGYNATLNKPTTTSATATYTSGAEGSTRLAQAFKSPEEMATFGTEVLGDQKVVLCTTGSDCPESTAVSTASGLGPKYEAEIALVQPTLATLVSAPRANYTDMKQISAPGMAVSPALVDSIRKLPPDARSMAVGRLSQELAMHRVIDKALVLRNALVTSLSLPEVSAAGDVSKEVQSKIDRLTQYINDMMFEFRIRKEMTAETALTLMSNQESRDSGAARVRDGGLNDPMPLEGGRVKSQ